MQDLIAVNDDNTTVRTIRQCDLFDTSQDNMYGIYSEDDNSIGRLDKSGILYIKTLPFHIGQCVFYKKSKFTKLGIIKHLPLSNNGEIVCVVEKVQFLKFGEGRYDYTIEGLNIFEVVNIESIKTTTEYELIKAHIDTENGKTVCPFSSDYDANKEPDNIDQKTTDNLLMTKKNVKDLL